MRSILLLSAGLDSTVCFKKAYDETDLVLALTFDYGQRSAKKEVESARNICKLYGVKHRAIKLSWLKEITNTALVNTNKLLPTLTQEQLDQTEITFQTAKLVWVPNRNGVFINIAAAFAESLNCDLIVTGYNLEEGTTFPDNSPAFIEAINASLALSTLKKVRLISYTQNLVKTEIVKLGREINAPLEYVWSCYRGDKEHCWKCESCQRLMRALKSTGNWEWFLEKRKILFKT